MIARSLAELLRLNRHYILGELDRLAVDSPMAGLHLANLQSETDRARLGQWIDLIIESIDSGPEKLLAFQKRTAFYRSREGVRFIEGGTYYVHFLKIAWSIIQQAAYEGRLDRSGLLADLDRLNMNCVQACVTAGVSHVETSQHIADETITYLEELYGYSYDLIQLINPGDITDLLVAKVCRLFQAQGCFISVGDDDSDLEIRGHPTRRCPPRLVEYLRDVSATGRPVFISIGGRPGHELGVNPMKSLVCLPVFPQISRFRALLIVGQRQGLVFNQRRMRILDHLLYVTELFLKNTDFVSEIRNSRRELSQLTGKIIHLQENERRILAADIHDTFTQTLTGIGYNLEILKQQAKTGVPVQPGELDEAIGLIHRAVDQARDLIAILSPQLMDTVGFTPALEQMIRNFEQDSGIRVQTDLVYDVDLPREQGICLFRVAQEALTNIRRHSGMAEAALLLTVEDGSVVLKVSDKGQGMAERDPLSLSRNRNRFGLLLMRERLKTVGGTLRIRSAPGSGLTLTAAIPVPTAEENGQT